MKEKKEVKKKKIKQKNHPNLNSPIQENLNI